MRWVVGAGFDPGFTSDSSGGCITCTALGPEPVYYVAALFERSPRKGAPLIPSVVTAEFCALAKSYGAEEVITDGHYVEAIREYVVNAGLTLCEAPGGAEGKLRVHDRGRELLHARRIRFASAHARLVRQINEIIYKPLPGGGIAISSPRRKHSHGDLASAFLLSLWRAQQLAKHGSGDNTLICAGNRWSPGGSYVRVHSLGGRRAGIDYSIEDAQERMADWIRRSG